MKAKLLDQIFFHLSNFTMWLERQGYTSQDQYDYWATSLGRRAKSIYYRHLYIGTAAVAPFVALDAFLPFTRQWFIKPKRFPIADAHYAMGFLYLSEVTGIRKYIENSQIFLTALKNSRCNGYKNYCWGYPFDWETCFGTFKAGTPLITNTPYAYEAFATIHGIDKNDYWLEIMHSIAEHAINDIPDVEVGRETRACSYSPFDKRQVVNANAYRAFLLTEAFTRFNEPKYWKVGQKNLNFVLSSQQPDGSWLYAMDGKDRFIDHFHTCFVLKNLVKIEQLTGYPGCQVSIEKGIRYYIDNLFNKQWLPKPFAREQRLTLYRRELYDYAECINLCVLLNKYSELRKILALVLEDLFARWIKSDGSFRTRQLIIGWNNVPYHRWAQSQIFRSLSFLLYKNNQQNLKHRKIL